MPTGPGIEIGWALHPDHCGKGYTTEAGAAAVEYTFAHHDVDALYSVILPENPRRRPVARRLGFTLCGDGARSRIFPRAAARHLATPADDERRRAIDDVRRDLGGDSPGRRRASVLRRCSVVHRDAVGAARR